MSAGNRIAIIAVGFVAAVLAFVALRPADEETTSSTTTTATTAERTTTTPATAVATTVRSTTTPGPETSTITVKGGQPVGGVQEIEAERGDEIRIRVTADAPEEVHLHGYDIEKPVGPGEPAVFNIDANLEGIFEIELHGSAVQIGSLQVSPK
ncbi:hypothetical protein LRS13_07985 [Svornostia abyssi]|uniref:EfeO-type cupredoxin-like domain-containing protein n=1 Tax=Svornostia abyssi TaxID=2898438 RepID=A0ABY5PLF3_9ACTN|nr:hypothetical protein LRS13_07985 [Parviterribacteraceae bacterium J379]